MSMDKFYYSDGHILAYLDCNKKLHREDGPACECNTGYKAWWVNGKRHRIDGPACIYHDGDKEWWIDGEELSEENFNKHPKVLKYKYEQQFYKELEERL